MESLQSFSWQAGWKERRRFKFTYRKPFSGPDVLDVADDWWLLMLMIMYNSLRFGHSLRSTQSFHPAFLTMLIELVRES
jgi:hypothetical protein